MLCGLYAVVLKTMQDVTDPKPTGPLPVPGVELSPSLNKYVKGFYIKFKNSSGKIIKRRVTRQQLRMIEGLMKGLKPTQAALNAGYKPTVKRNITTLMGRKVIRTLMSTLANKFDNAGLTMDFWVDRFKEWASAKKPVVTKEGVKKYPDYDTQIKSFDRYKEVIKDDEHKGSGRKISFEEWIND